MTRDVTVEGVFHKALTKALQMDGPRHLMTWVAKKNPPFLGQSRF